MTRYVLLLVGSLILLGGTLHSGSSSREKWIEEEEPQGPMTREERLEYLDRGISHWELSRKKQERRARYYEREAARLQYHDVGYARRYFHRADWHRERAVEAAKKVEEYRRKKQEFLQSNPADAN